MGVELIKTMFNNTRNKLSQKQAYIKEKKRLLDCLTIKELENLYTSYIERSLTTKETIRNDKDQYERVDRPLTAKEVKRAVYRKVSIEQILNLYPKLESKVNKEVL